MKARSVCCFAEADANTAPVTRHAQFKPGQSWWFWGRQSQGAFYWILQTTHRFGALAAVHHGQQARKADLRVCSLAKLSVYSPQLGARSTRR